MRTTYLFSSLLPVKWKQLPNQTKNHSNNSVDPHGWIHSDKYTQTQTYTRPLHNMYDIRVIYRCNINQEHIYK